MTAFIGIVKALYDYEPQTDEELAIQENDLLYLLEKSDIDEWWTVKKRVIGLDAEEPTGLVPSNYVESADVIGVVKALYDYEEVQNPEEEVTFHENELFDVYDDKDQDWLLVQSKSSGAYGFIPGNYVEPAQSLPKTPATAPEPAPIAPPIMTPTGTEESVPPPPPPLPPQSQGSGRAPDDVSPALPTRPRPGSEEPPLPTRPNDQGRFLPEPPLPPMGDESEEPPLPTRPRDRLDEDEDVPPPKPMRPTSTGGGPSLGGLAGAGTERDDYHLGRRIDDEDEDIGYSDGGYEDAESSYYTWNAAEVDGRKKKKCKLTVGGNKIYFEPIDGPHEEWTIDKLTSYDSEKKHIFLDFVEPYRSLELHAGSSSTCNEIMTILGEFKGAQRDPGLHEIEEASRPKKQANVIYDFRAESADELTIRQGQVVYIINDKKSRDWWLCELVSNGKRGVVPADCLEPIKEKSSGNGSGSGTGGGFFGSLRRITGNTEKYNAKQHAKQAGRRERDRERERLKEGNRGRGNRENSWKDDEAQSLSSVSNERRSLDRRSASVAAKRSSSSSSGQKNEFPDPKKTRIWADRSNTFKVEAQFIGCTEGKIHLHKANGVKIAVAAEKLSEEDLVYVERATGFSLDKFKPKSSGSNDKRRKSIKEHEEEERDRYLRQKELDELRKARQMLDDERAKVQEMTEPKPPKPPRPQSTGGTNTMTLNYHPQYDWFEFFLNCGVDVSNCQRYTINFEREKITEDMMKDINEPMLRTLGLREGDIVRVMKYLDNKFNRASTLPQGQATGGMFSQPDGSLKVSTGDTSNAQPLTQNFLPQATGPIANPISREPSAPPASTTKTDDDAWTAKPAAKSEASEANDNKNSNFTGSMQDLIDLRPLEPKKKESSGTPEPNLKDLEPVKTGGENKPAPISSAPTGGTTLQPLDPFKTGGNNLLPLATGFVMMPVATGGLMPMQRTGGLVMPQTTFGTQNTGGLIQPQRTNSAVMPVGLQSTGGGLQPQVTNQALTSMNFQTTGGALQPQRTNNILPMNVGSGGMMPQTTFGSQPIQSTMPLQSTGGTMPRLGSVLPVQKTGSGLMPLQPSGNAMSVQGTGGFVQQQRTGGIPTQPSGNLIPLQKTGGNLMPQTSFGGLQTTGGANMMPQTSFGGLQTTGGANMMPQTSFGGLQTTGGANMMPQTSFGGFQTTGGANMMPQTSFGGLQTTGGANMMPQTSFSGPQTTGGANMMPQNSFGGPQMTGNFTSMPQTNFGGTQMSGGLPQPSFGNQMQGNGSYPNIIPSGPQITGGFQQNGQFGTQNQFTGGPMLQQSFPGSSFNTGVDNTTHEMQNMSLSQQAPLQAQPTGFGFGNGPQQPQQSQHGPKQANLFNATPDNPFGF